MYNKCHVCLGSYNETAQHAKRQHNGAEESSRQQRRGARQGGVQGRATEQGSKAAGQGSRARQQGKAGEQGSRARQGSRAGQQAKFNLQTAAEGEHLSTNMFSLSRVFTHWHKPICKRLQRCGHLSKHMLTFARVY